MHPYANMYCIGRSSMCFEHCQWSGLPFYGDRSPAQCPMIPSGMKMVQVFTVTKVEHESRYFSMHKRTNNNRTYESEREPEKKGPVNNPFDYELWRIKGKNRRQERGVQGSVSYFLMTNDVRYVIPLIDIATENSTLRGRSILSTYHFR